MRLAACAIIVGLLSPTPTPTPTLSWVSVSSSPVPLSPSGLTDRESDLLAHCGTGDRALSRVAARVVERKIFGLPYLDVEGLGFAQRVEGEPHVWPRAWVVSGRALDHESTLKKLEEWRKSFRDLGQRRCGVATGFARDGSEVIAAIALDALADLEPIPTRARTGQWIDVEAHMLVPASAARVIVLGPGGEPRRVPTSLEGSRVRARFAPDRPGAFTVQLVAEVATGPRPILEARVFADVAPPSEMPSLVAPGEDAGQGTDPATQLAAMVNALRDAEGLAHITREAPLDDIASAHAKRMMQARAVAHDVGDGEPSQRVQNANIRAREAGENVAHAATIQLAHRALWASPSHRANLLRGDFVRGGFGVAEDADGSVWACELYVK